MIFELFIKATSSKNPTHLVQIQGSSIHHHQNGHLLGFPHLEGRREPAVHLSHQKGRDLRDLKQKQQFIQTFSEVQVLNLNNFIH